MNLINNEDILIIKKADGTFTKGQYSDGAVTYIPATASCQPINDAELQILKLGDRVKGSLKIYSYSEILEDYFMRRIDPVKAPGENIAKIVTCTIDNIIDSTDYTCTIDGTVFTYNSGIGATALSIVAGIVIEISGGVELVTTVDNLNGTYTITSSIKGNDFVIAVDANQSINIDVANVKKEYKIMQSKNYTSHNIKYYKAYGFLVESPNGL